MTGHTGLGFPYALPTDALIDWPTASLELAAKLNARAAVVTALPSSPADGDEVYYLATIGAQTALWHLRYRAAATAPHKWECIGGQPITMAQTAVASNGATINTWINIMPSTIAAPLAGEYLCAAQGQMAAGVGGACTMYASFYLGAPASNAGMLNSVLLGGASWSAAFAVPQQRIPLTAGQVLGLAGTSNIANCGWSNIGLTVIPLRVS